MTQSDHCVCHSGKNFKKCCDRFLNSGELPKTPEQLMRSRYSAYALGGYGEYLLQTWLPAMSQGLTTQQLSKKDNEWVGLEVITKSQQGDNGQVEFKAYYLEPNNAGQNKKVLHEKSVFKRIDGNWLYVGGEIEES